GFAQKADLHRQVLTPCELALAVNRLYEFIRLETLAIYMLAFQRPGLHARQAVDVNCNHRRAIGHLAVSEAFDSANVAEKVAYLLLVKEILGEVFFAGFELEIFKGCKCQYKAHALTTRAVTGNRALQVYIDLVAYCS